MNKTNLYLKGMKDGIPIGLAYFAVALSLGISARNVGLNPIEGFVASFFTYASAGEYAAFTLIGDNGSYLAMALIILVANCRYILMSFSLSQKMNPEESIFKRFIAGYCITDEIYAISLARGGYISPMYMLGAFTVAVFPWAIATSIGIIIGNALPAIIVNALSCSIYGMFIAIIIPPAKKDKKVMLSIIVSFILSYITTKINLGINEGLRIIILTVVISLAFSIIFPKTEEELNA